MALMGCFCGYLTGFVVAHFRNFICNSAKAFAGKMQVSATEVKTVASVAGREAVSRRHGGIITPEQQPKGQRVGGPKMGVLI